MNNDKMGNNKKPNLIKKILHYAGVLTVVCLLSGAGVSLLYVASAERIQQQANLAFEEALEVVLGDASSPQEVIEDAMWVAEKPDDSPRYIAEATARGYQSDITVLVAVDGEPEKPVRLEEAKVYAMTVLSSAETPGLGENINAVKQTVSLWEAMLGRGEEPGRPWFQTQFEGKKYGAVALEKDNGAVDAVTGATETSDAVVEAVRHALKMISERTHELYD